MKRYKITFTFLYFFTQTFKVVSHKYICSLTGRESFKDIEAIEMLLKNGSIITVNVSKYTSWHIKKDFTNKTEEKQNGE